MAVFPTFARAPDARLRPPFALGAVGPVPEPLRGGPLLPPVDRAAPVQGLRVVVTGGVHGPEQKRGALSRRDVQLARRARRGEASFGSVFRVFRVVRRRATSAFKNRHRLVFFSHSFAPGKHRLAASLDVAQVHQHSRDALAAVLDVFVVREVIEVRIVLLPALVTQDLDALAVIDRDHRERGDALLDASHDSVFGSAYEVAGARAHVARF